MTSLSVSIYAAFAVALPVLLWQMWSYLAPAFQETNQKAVARVVIVATILFAGGVAFGYFVALPRAMPFLLGFDAELYDIEIRARDYYRFATMVLFGLGTLFLVPILVLGLVRLRIVSAATFRRQWRIGVVLCTVVAVILPGVDPITTLIMMAPIFALYFGSIWAAVYFERRWSKNWSTHANRSPGRASPNREVTRHGNHRTLGHRGHRRGDRAPLRRQAAARHGALARPELARSSRTRSSRRPTSSATA